MLQAVEAHDNYRSEYTRPKRKPVPVRNQYERLQSLPTTKEEPKISTISIDQPIWRDPTKRSGSWLWEAISFAVAIACFASIVSMLLSLDKTPVPEWPSGTSVNAILSVIVTVMKGAMGLCVAECLSQIKWTWFKKDRKLVDLVIIDGASQGILGAGRLLFTLRAWYLAYAGSFIFLAAFLIGPTVQQMVEFQVEKVPLALNATVPVCNNTYYKGMGLGAASGQNKVNLPMTGAMYDGFLQTSSQSPMRPNCPSGNCTFPRHQSSGLCHQCTDLSDQLTYLNSVTNDTIPTTIDSVCSRLNVSCAVQWPKAGLSIQANFGMINSTQASLTKIDASLVSSDDATINIFRAIISRAWLKQKRTPPPVAVQCALRFCVKTYDAAINAGDFEEVVVATSWRDSYLPSGKWGFGSLFILPAKPCYVNGTEIVEPWNDKDRTHCVYNVTGQSGIAINNTLNILTSGHGWASVSNRPSLSNDIMQSLYGLFNVSSLESDDIGTFESVDRAFKSLTDVMTNHARGSFANCGGAVAYGTQYSDQLYIHVRWIWLIPTTVVLTLCLVFFLATIVQSWRDDLWKSSPLAYIFCRTANADGIVTPEDMLRIKQLGPTSKLSVIEKAAGEIEVRFERRSE